MSGLTLSSPAAYTDFNHLTELRAQAKNQTPESKREVAQQFEALFLQMMIKSMRDAGGTEDRFMGGKNSELYWDMYNKQIAMDLSASGGIGLADIIYQQLGGEEVAMTSGEMLNSIPGRHSALNVFSDSSSDYSTTLNDISEVSKKAETAEMTSTMSWETPLAFIKDLYSAAKEAASELRTEPEAILSIAALESAWGQSVIKHQNGVSSYNLFGIKANKHWQGSKVVSSTLEFEQGAMIRKKELFRAYASPQESIKDFVAFINDNPRYRAITEKPNNAITFIKNLKDAGYATDPAYENKLLSVLNSKTLKNALTPLKNLNL